MKLISPDIKRCQCESLTGSFMTFGPRNIVRCNNKPIVIATERKNPKGSMSLCKKCLDKAVQQLGRKTFSLKELK